MHIHHTHFTQILDGQEHSGTFVLVDEKGEPIRKKSKATLSISIKYISVEAVWMVSFLDVCFVHVWACDTTVVHIHHQHLLIHHIPIPSQERPLYEKGITKSGFVPHTFFPMRQGNAVRLYNDAHNPHAGPNPKIPLATGAMYEEKSCWDDLYADLQAAKVFVYVAGWSVVDHTTLVRSFEKTEQPGPTIGELLKHKADDEKLKVGFVGWGVLFT